MYRQVLDPLGSPALTALLAATPLLVLLTLLGILRVRSHLAALAGLATALLIATLGYHMPLGQAADSAVEGAAFGLFPIVWIVLGAVWINRLQRTSGHFDVIARTFSSLSGDTRVQAVLIAYCFGAMIESLSGFGTPIAITSLILLILGLSPLKAAAVATFANTAPAAFGSVGNPIQALAKVTSLPVGDLGAMVGRQSAVIAALVPLALLLLLDGRRGLRELWPVGLTAGLGFGAGQFLCSNYLTYQLTDLMAALLSLLSVLVLLRLRAPRRQRGARPDSRRDILKAFSPYGILTVLFALVSFRGPVSRFVNAQDVSFAWPGLRVTSGSGGRLAVETFDFGWLGAAGTMLLLTGILTAVLLRVPARRALRCYGEACYQLRWATLTIACILALSYVMNLAGMAVSLGVWLAGTGSAFIFLSGFLGWFGSALTGSDTSSNALFGAMQVSAAQHTGLAPLLAAATNSTGGVQGKAAAMQNLVIAASAVGLSSREGEILRRVIGWSLGILAVFTLLAWLQSTSVLGWMVP